MGVNSEKHAWTLGQVGGDAVMTAGHYKTKPVENFREDESTFTYIYQNSEVKQTKKNKNQFLLE